MIPQLDPQMTLVRPAGLHMQLSVLWTPRHDHSIVRTTLRAGIDGELLAMGVGSAPEWPDYGDLGRALATSVMHSVAIAHNAYVNPEPF